MTRSSIRINIQLTRSSRLERLFLSSSSDPTETTHNVLQYYYFTLLSVYLLRDHVIALLKQTTK